IGKVVIASSNTVLVASVGHLYSPNKERGVFKTTNGGETWKQTLFIDANTGVIDLIEDPVNKQVFYAVSWYRERRAWNFVEGGKTSGIYKSSDGGETWKLLTNPECGMACGENTGRIGLGIFPGNSQILYAIVDNQSREPEKADQDPKTKPLKPAEFRVMTRDQFLALDQKKLKEFLEDYEFPEKYDLKTVNEMVRSGKIQPVALADYVSDANSDLFSKPIIGAEVYRSDDGGTSWRKMNDAPLEGFFYTYGYYFGKIWVSPFSADEVYIAGVSLLKSKNGGKKFESIEGENQHGDHHAMWINPSRRGHLINGNDGGVNVSWDDGKHWLKANTPAVGQFYSVNADMARPYNVYGGLQDNGVWVGPHTNRANVEWHSLGQYAFRPILGGDGMQVQVDTRDNNTVYTGYQFGHYFRVNRATEDATPIEPERELGDKPLRFNWQAPIWLSVHNQDIFYLGAHKLFRSLNKGDDLKAISGDLTRGGRVGDVPYGTLSSIHESPMKFGLLYTGSDDGLVHVSKDGGNNWDRISDKLPQHLRVNRVIASAHEEGRVYVVLSGFQWDHFKSYVYVSENYGGSWTQIFKDLPPDPVNVIREDPVNPNLLFTGTDHGLYFTLDRGKTSMQLTNGFPAVAVHDLVIQPREHDLVVGTHGRSIYIADISALEMLHDSILNQELYVYSPGSITQKVAFEKIGGDWKQIAATDVNLTWYTKKSGPTLVLLKSADGKQTFAELRDTSEAGLNFLRTRLFVDSAYADKYREWLTSIEVKDEPKKFTKGRLLLLPGEYLVEVILPGETRRTTKLNVRKRGSKVEQ
ncbi:MAG TPA: glycosyl hydrolase, partial [Bacteroidia bacterium]|nr:glycosyl hydrolase [Bacteroidia bacterium]